MEASSIGGAPVNPASVAAARRSQRWIWAWVALGFAAYLLLPWYAIQDATWYEAVPQVFGQAEGANGLMQAAMQGRSWLFIGLAGLVMCAVGAWLPAGRGQGRWLLAGGAIGAIGLSLAGFTIGARGWSVAALNTQFGELAINQFGIGAGGFVALTALVLLAAFGVARLGLFKGDLFVAAAVIGCGVLMALFIAYPVSKALSGAFFNEDGQWSIGAFIARVFTERIWGLGCLAGGVRCGVAWNTLVLALLTAAGTTFLGTLMALMAERGSKRGQGALRVLALLPIITPPFVVGLGLILLFGRAGIVNQMLENVFGIEPTRWFYGMPGVLVAQLFAFTPIAFMIMRGVVQGIAPSLEEAAQMLRADRRRTFFTITLPLLKPGLANAFLVGFIESIADFGNPVVVGGQFSVLSTDIFFAIVGAQYDQGRAASLAWVLTLFALGVFALQRGLLGKQNYTTVSGKGDAGIAMALPDGVRRTIYCIALPWIAFTAVVYLFAFAGGFVQTWGRDYSFTLNHFKNAFALEWGQFGLVWAGTAWNSLITTLKLAGISAPITAALGLLIAWLLARNEFKGQGIFEFGALLAFAIPGTVLGVSYILAFNVPPLELTGTGLIIVLCFMFRNLPVGVRAGTAAFKQLDRSLDEASLMLRASTSQTLFKVVLPLLKPALVAALVYSFVRAMTTVSAVIFLVTAENELATTYIIGRVGNGDYGIALAYCTVLMILMSLAIALVQFVVGERKLGRRGATPPHQGHHKMESLATP
ncbi:iron(III) transport system permease protein [Variovorax boronicumulans]|uniref:Iron(III) transport system permease protein n=1 Tax=Variovorax boronicumulans TaxID=436515 RepID=A0AAW8D110_9BURK|nr:iron ABC transporter permease [Variovorax boronicumulans]MDP9895146.1 iron(III) transport system permease protein [Variovorax boronicumulans]MDQ0054964.1 iron(III) transport system permease protein [Variovorax boronicumulans]